MLNPTLEESFNKAIELAQSAHHEFVSLEHILLALLENKLTKEILKGCGVNIKLLKSELEDFIKNEFDSEQSKDSKLPEAQNKPELTIAFQRVLQNAAIQVQSSGKNEVGIENILVAYFHETHSHALYFLKKSGLSQFDLINYISHGIEKDEDEEDFRADYSEDDDEDASETKELAIDGLPKEESDEGESTKGSPLKSFTINLNEQARNGELDPLVGREDVVGRAIQVLCRRTKNNPLFVGEPGVGKTAIAAGLAQRIVNNDVPEKLKLTTIYSLDMGALLAGT